MIDWLGVVMSLPLALGVIILIGYAIGDEVYARCKHERTHICAGAEEDYTICDRCKSVVKIREVEE